MLVNFKHWWRILIWLHAITETWLDHRITYTNDSIHNYFTVKDNYLWQLVDFPTRAKNRLDLVITNIPDKVGNVQGFDNFLKTDHKLISFTVNLNVQKKPKTKRTVWNIQGEIPRWATKFLMRKGLRSKRRSSPCILSMQSTDHSSSWDCLLATLPSTTTLLCSSIPIYQIRTYKLE